MKLYDYFLNDKASNAIKIAERVCLFVYFCLGRRAVIAFIISVDQTCRVHQIHRTLRLPHLELEMQPWQLTSESSRLCFPLQVTL